MPDSFSIKEVLDFWFDPQHRNLWFRSTEAFYQLIHDRFQRLWEQASKGELRDWMDSAQGCLALAIVLDQFPLNMFRGEAKSFSTEQQAIEVTRHALSAHYDQEVPNDQVAFLYMPLMHSESLVDQEQSVQVFDARGLAENARFARHHYELIRRFGRFPHRNSILGRESTQEELEYLASKEAFRGYKLINMEHKFD